MLAEQGKSEHLYRVIAVPLNRPDLTQYISSLTAQPRGLPVRVVGQRPRLDVRQRWLEELCQAETPSLSQFLTIDDLHGHLTVTTTDRLVPVEHLEVSDFLTRNLGGWIAIYFGVVGTELDIAGDPFIDHMEVLGTYGEQLRSFGADSQQIAARLEPELGLSLPEIGFALCQLQALQYAPGISRQQSVERVYQRILKGPDAKLPLPLLYDALIDDMVHIELARRDALANQDYERLEQYEGWIEKQKQDLNLCLILKGEYIMGRHRRSTILIAPDLGVVVKQPAPEPFHEVQLNARTYAGEPENWPVLMESGVLVTPRGRIRLIIEQNVVPRLYEAFEHPAHFSTTFGLTFEAFVPGETLQQAVWGRHDVLNPATYEQIVLHQLVCENLGVENGDWHSANFILDEMKMTLIHIDWGAARPLSEPELTEELRDQRLEQVRNIAFSFHDDALAQRVIQLHDELVADTERLQHLFNKADEIASAHRLC